MSTYILQKDTPNTKAGDEFYYTPNNYMDRGKGYTNKAGMFWHKLIVENTPEWFKPKGGPGFYLGVDPFRKGEKVLAYKGRYAGQDDTVFYKIQGTGKFYAQYLGSDIIVTEVDLLMAGAKPIYENLFSHDKINKRLAELKRKPSLFEIDSVYYDKKIYSKSGDDLDYPFQNDKTGRFSEEFLMENLHCATAIRSLKRISDGRVFILKQENVNPAN